MNNKIDIAELLKDCPAGMELDCTNYDGVVKFDGFNKHNPYAIRISVNHDGEVTIHNLTKYGQTEVSSYNKCVIFPKGSTTWEGFQRPFKDGDFVHYNDTVAIFKEWGDETLFRTHAAVYLSAYPFFDVNIPLFGEKVRKEIRHATEEEREKLLKAMKMGGYTWNPSTRTLSELTKDKFDLNTLKPFESRVLVRYGNEKKWIPAIYGFYDEDAEVYFYWTVGGGVFPCCIPYEGNEHLLGTTDECEEYYKTWK